LGKKASPVVIGAFVVGALALAIVGVGVFGSGRLFNRTDEWVMYFRGSVNGLRVGAPVKFKGVEIGAVQSILLNLTRRERRPEQIRIPVIVEIDAERVVRKGGQVVMHNQLPSMIEQGFRAQLNSESIVTGVLYVELDFFPGTPVNLVRDPEVSLPEIPTLPTTFEQVQMKASEIINRLGEIDVAALVRSVEKVVDGLARLVNSPAVLKAAESLDETVENLNAAIAAVRKLTTDLDASAGPLAHDLRRTAERAAATLDQVQALVAPDAALPYQLSRTLHDLSEAATAVRALADYLERNPASLVRGKPEGAEAP
jgi:paraquat-inducible protein B